MAAREQTEIQNLPTGIGLVFAGQIARGGFIRWAEGTKAGVKRQRVVNFSLLCLRNGAPGQGHGFVSIAVDVHNA